MEQDTDVTPTVFRKWKDGGGIIALFPTLNWKSGDCNFGYVMSYMHVGQHGEANYHAVVQASYPVTSEEYADLKTELESIGYKIRPIRRATWKQGS